MIKLFYDYMFIQYLYDLHLEFSKLSKIEKLPNKNTENNFNAHIIL